TDDGYTGLANLNLPEAMRKSTLDDYESVPVDLTVASSKADNELATKFAYAGITANLEQKIGITLAYSKKDSSITAADFANYEFRGSYTDVSGNEQEFVIDGSRFSALSSYVTVTIDVIGAKDLRQMFTAAFYDKATGAQVSDTITTSFECYAVSQLKSAKESEALKTTVKAILGYCDAAKDYLTF
ncbi:MAG: hypothetical protein IJU41_03005, partial [Clostridia bacterium]|nr:hypothetical protein [Clostridia bacterium]